MHIYAFGSICRGEVDFGSDVDLLAIVEGNNNQFNPAEYSIYSYSRIQELWQEGSPFAWHLALESKLIHSSDGKNFLKNLGKPSAYRNGFDDCKKFYSIYSTAYNSLKQSNHSAIFDMSTIFLSIRNFATCYSLAFCEKPDFSRNSARKLGSNSIIISDIAYSILEKSRLLCTRGVGDILRRSEIDHVKYEIDKIENWMLAILGKINEEEK